MMGQDQKQMVKHDRRSMAEYDRRSVIFVCKDEMDWIDPKTGVPYAEIEMVI